MSQEREPLLPAKVKHVTEATEAGEKRERERISVSDIHPEKQNSKVESRTSKTWLLCLGQHHTKERMMCGGNVLLEHFEWIMEIHAASLLLLIKPLSTVLIVNLSFVRVG